MRFTKPSHLEFGTYTRIEAHRSERNDEAKHQSRNGADHADQERHPEPVNTIFSALPLDVVVLGDCSPPTFRLRLSFSAEAHHIQLPIRSDMLNPASNRIAACTRNRPRNSVRQVRFSTSLHPLDDEPSPRLANRQRFHRSMLLVGPKLGVRSHH